MAKKRSQVLQKAASMGGVQSNSLPGPLRELVRVARINPAFLINFNIPRKSRIIGRWRKGADGRGVRFQWRTTGAREVVSQELKFKNGKYTLGEAVSKTLESKELTNLAEMLYKHECLDQN